MNRQLSKIALLISAAAILALPGCKQEASWDDPEIRDTYMKNCNPKNDAAIQKVCDCALGKIKEKFPNAAQEIPPAEVEAMAKACATETEPG